MGLGPKFAIELKSIMLQPLNFRIAKINLHKNSLGDSGIKALMKAVKRSKTLVHLNLSSNDICNDGMISIFKGL